ncbi:MAG: hypothetical protein Q8M03_15335 [Legionella sp.]|nr:hypothetical protein [Legionella sp.]
MASDIMVAVSNLGRVYIYKPTENIQPFCWSSSLGAPDFFSDKLFLPTERRAWAFSCSVRAKPEVRKTDFINPREIVAYFSDGNNINFDFGFTPTIYVLDKDGLKIVYWDTGLPASFSRGFLVPDGTQGQSISAAGSTVFLSAIDSDGKLHFYTRMIDYEINGSCPGLKVSFADIPVELPPDGPDGSFFLGHGVRKLPLKGWVEHSVDDILPDITGKVCIRLTGQGDNARELRIQGRDKDLGWGYYFKNIAESGWQFHPEPAAAPVKPSETTAFPYNPLFPETLKLSYTETLSFAEKFLASTIPWPKKAENTAKVTLAIKDFHPFLTDAEPFFLVLNYPGETSQYLQIHAVDAWGLHYHNKHDEYLVGTVDGEPKPLIGTLILTPEQIELAQKADSAIGAHLKNHFLKYHAKTKAIPIIADNKMVILKCGCKDYNFERKVPKKERVQSFYVRKANDEALTLKPQSLEECALLLEKNRECLKEIEFIFSTRQKTDKDFAKMNVGASLLRPIASGIFKVFIRPEDPTYEQAMEDIKPLFREHRQATAYSARGKSKAEGYEQALCILNFRIETLEEMSQHFEERTIVCNA